MKISIITPCFNEELNVFECAKQLSLVFQNALPDYEYEHIFADNASTDSTLEILRKMARTDSRIKVIANSRNVGPFRNMWNAMKSASGDAVIPLLPADLQDPPDIIPKFVERWEAGNLVVFGTRDKRQENYFLKHLRFMYYKIIRKLASSEIPLNAGEFLLADKRVIDSILSIDDQYPYIRGLIAQTGVKFETISYTWAKRNRGKSKNSFLSLIDQAINGFVSTSRMAARFSLISGFLFSFFGLIYAVYISLLVIFTEQNFPMGTPTLIVGIFMLGGIQLFFLGVIGEYVLSIHGQVKKQPPMFELERLNF